MPYANPEKRREYSKRHYLENKERYKEKAREWDRRNPEKVKLRGATRYAKNPDEELKRYKAWVEKNKEWNREYQREYKKKWRINNPGMDWRARMYRLPGKCTIDEWEAKLEKYGRRCSGCGVIDVPLTVDHIIPVTAPGSSNWIENLQPLCRPCNSSKKNNPDWIPPIMKRKLWQ